MNPARRFPSIERLEDRIAPATFLVTSLFDNTNPGSLRVAIAEANANPGPDTITFKAGLTGTINLGLGALTIDDEVKIKGPGSTKLTIDGGGFFRIFNIANPATEEPVSISGLTLTNAASNAGDGRALASTEPLSLTDVKFTANTGGGVTGGALYVETVGNITIKNVQFVGNGGSTGGGAYFKLSGTGGKIVISNTLFQSNQASAEAGAFGVFFDGVGQSLTVERSTFLVQNGGFAVGGAISVRGAGTVLVKGSTFTGNVVGASGGAIFQELGSLTVDASTFTNNRGSTTGGAIVFAGDQFTMKNSTFTTNQSNSAMFGGGAVRLDGVGVWKVTGSKFTGNRAAGDGGAISATGGMGEIFGSTFRANQSDGQGGGIYLSNTTATVKSSLFSANNAAAGGAVSTDKTPLTVVGSRFTGNFATGEGGALLTFDLTVAVSGSIFDHNASLGAGGAVSLHSNFTSVGSVYRDNYAGDSGGAIAMPLDAGLLTMKGGSVIGNRAAVAGGGICVLNTDGVSLEKMIISDNHAIDFGGGVLVQLPIAVPVSIVGNTIRDNTAGLAGFGGGLFLNAVANALLTKNKITGNVAGTGGGVYLFGTVIATGNAIAGNFAFTDPETSGI